MRTTTRQHLSTRPPARLKVAPKATDPHYRSPEHVAWSKAVLKRAGGMCQSCGKTDGRLYADHVVELKDGGAPLDVANGQSLCHSCHGRKTAEARRRRQHGTEDK